MLVQVPLGLIQPLLVFVGSDRSRGGRAGANSNLWIYKESE
jgi:hypothetical protein